MHFMYVDESGDPASHQYGSSQFILCGLVVSQNDWHKCLDRLKAFRKALYDSYGLNQREEIHASELIRIDKIQHYKKIKKKDRINILKDYITQIPLIFNTAKVLSVCIDKGEHGDKDMFELAWGRLIQRYDTFLRKDANDKGIIITDDTDSKKLMNLQRRMRIYNPTPSIFNGDSYNAPIDNIIEDPFSRSSHHSHFIQTADVIVYSLFRKEFPKGSLKKYGMENQFEKLDSILLKKASRTDDLGIVRK